MAISEEGNYQPEKRLIQVHPDRPEEMQRATFLHELIHASVSIAGQTPKDVTPEDPEEVLARGVEIGFFSMMQDKRNAWAWKYLLDGEGHNQAR
jgi:hypothetical protein